MPLAAELAALFKFQRVRTPEVATDPKRVSPDLLSFAAITDDPEPEVAAAGHDRTVINVKPEHVEAWLNPGGDLAKMYAIFDDRQHPYYEHRIAA